MANTVKSCDYPEAIATKVFEMLNTGKVTLKGKYPQLSIVTDVEPSDLVYPEGWYYAKGTFRNKHTSSTGAYSEVEMLKTSGEFWEDTAKYCTR